MIQRTLIQLVLLAFFSPGLAQTNKLDDYLISLLAEEIIPGFSVVVVQGEELLYCKGFGREYLDAPQLMRASSSTAAGSLTKSFTAMAIMQLKEEGLLDLDEPVVTYLPWFQTANKALSDKITVRMLINNTSGLSAPAFRSSDNSKLALETLGRSYASVYLNKEPGESYAYSNDGFALAGLLIQKLTGTPYHNYLKEHIFAPLQMTRTTDDPAEFENLNVLYGHYPGIDEAIPVMAENDNLQEYAPAGSMMRTSAKDLGNYLVALLNGGRYSNTQVLSDENIRLMWEVNSSFPGISVDDGGEGLPFHYGLGWFMGEIDGRDYVFHGGNRRNMSSMTILCPDENIGVAFLANMDLTFIDRYRFPNLIHIVNNIIRVSLGDDISDFALPTIKDATLNSYVLPTSREKGYLGEYRLAEGNDWVYLGSRLILLKGKEGIVGEIWKQEQLIERFTLDFVSRKTAVSRNLHMPQQIQFKFLNEDRISDVFVNNRRYARIPEKYAQMFTRNYSPDGSISFDLPIEWKLEWNGVTLNSRKEGKHTETLKGGIFSMETSAEGYFNELFPSHRISYKGLAMSEFSGTNQWQEIAFYTSHNGQKYQHQVCISRNGRQSFVFVISSSSELTRSISAILPVFLESFTWNPM